jgi:hypothetical protein
MTAKGVKKLMGIIIGLMLIVLTGWIGIRWWIFQKEEAPLRDGINASKEGNFQLALAELKPYADKGNTHAQSVLGEMYARGLGVPYDEVQASMWFRRAERGRKVTGMAEFGMFKWYLEVQPDLEKAARWLQRAAEAGNSDAQGLIADEKRLTEKGLKVDPAVTEYWRKFASPSP